jgi:hypothetical protein
MPTVLTITSDNDTATFHHDLWIGSTCDMKYIINGHWPVNFAGTVFMNVRGTLTLDVPRAPFVINELDNGVVIVLSRNVSFDRLLDLRSSVKFLADHPVTLTVTEAIVDSLHPVTFVNVTTSIDRIGHIGGGFSLLPSFTISNSFVVRQPAIIDARKVHFGSSMSVVSLPFTPQSRTFIRLGIIDVGEPVLNITVIGIPHPLLFGRLIKVVCAQEWKVLRPSVSVVSVAKIAVQWQKVSEGECLVLVFEHSPASDEDDSSEFFFGDDDDDDVMLYISAWILAGVAIGLVLLMLWVCWRRGRANRPEAFEQVHERRETGQEEVIQIDDIDEDVL